MAMVASPGEYPFSRHPRLMYRKHRGPCASTPASHPADTNKRFKYPHRQRPDRPARRLRPPTQIASTPTSRRRGRDRVASACRSDTRRLRGGLRRHRSQKITSRSPSKRGGHPHRQYLAYGREARYDVPSCCAARAERHPQGVHRPPHLDLPGGLVRLVGDPAILRRAAPKLHARSRVRLHIRVSGPTRHRKAYAFCIAKAYATTSSSAACTSTSFPGGSPTTSTSSATSSSRWASSAPARPVAKI